MSRTSVIYIEYRKNHDSPWRWINPLMNSDDVSWADNEPNYMVDINGDDNKVAYKRVYELNKQGTIRDIFNDNDVSFNNRQWPKDMSKELSAYIKNNKDQFDGIWGKSHASLKEVIDYIDIQIANFKGYKNDYKERQNNITIHDKLDMILKVLGGSKTNIDIENLLNTNSDNTNDEDYDEYILEYDEVIDSYMYAKSFLEGINQIVDFCTNNWVDENNIRLIYFTC